MARRRTSALPVERRRSARAVAMAAGSLLSGAARLVAADVDCGSPATPLDASQRAWCCAMRGIGCGAAVEGPDGHYDCEDGHDRWEVSWSSRQKDWCCRHTGRACDPYDCTEGAPQFWTSSKKGYCCAHKGIYCEEVDGVPANQDDRYDCNDGLADWEFRWASKKKAWCCQQQAIPTCDAFDCRAELGGAPWPAKKAKWCCEYRQSGCPSQPTTTRPITFDCSLSVQSWETEWTLDRKTWCCQQRGVACDPFDCEPKASNLMAQWSPRKISWCCRHRGEGCPTTTPPPPLPSEYGGHGGDDLDCKFNLAKAVTLWSPGKKVICCIREGRGCPQTEDLDALPAAEASPLRLNEVGVLQVSEGGGRSALRVVTAERVGNSFGAVVSARIPLFALALAFAAAAFGRKVTLRRAASSRSCSSAHVALRAEPLEHC
mmetsp:Transcript_26195/g.74466  ORF Transcript_26195/g.74466 Transcript_26195/m.74466 type:complete len:431 (+) Transcript_26195:26-1318(+)